MFSTLSCKEKGANHCYEQGAPDVLGRGREGASTRAAWTRRTVVCLECVSGGTSPEVSAVTVEEEEEATPFEEDVRVSVGPSSLVLLKLTPGNQYTLEDLHFQSPPPLDSLSKRQRFRGSRPRPRPLIPLIPFGVGAGIGAGGFRPGRTETETETAEPTSTASTNATSTGNSTTTAGVPLNTAPSSVASTLSYGGVLTVVWAGIAGWIVLEWS